MISGLTHIASSDKIASATTSLQVVHYDESAESDASPTSSIPSNRQPPARSLPGATQIPPCIAGVELSRSAMVSDSVSPVISSRMVSRVFIWQHKEIKLLPVAIRRRSRPVCQHRVCEPVERRLSQFIRSCSPRRRASGSIMVDSLGFFPCRDPSLPRLEIAGIDFQTNSRSRPPSHQTFSRYSTCRDAVYISRIRRYDG